MKIGEIWAGLGIFWPKWTKIPEICNKFGVSLHLPESLHRDIGSHIDFWVRSMRIQHQFERIQQFWTNLHGKQPITPLYERDNGRIMRLEEFLGQMMQIYRHFDVFCILERKCVIIVQIEGQTGFYRALEGLRVVMGDVVELGGENEG